MSLAGSWFGVSMIALNPYDLWNRFKGRNLVSSASSPNEMFTCVNINLSLRDKVMKEKLAQRLNTVKLHYDYRTRILEREIIQIKNHIRNATF